MNKPVILVTGGATILFFILPVLLLPMIGAWQAGTLAVLGIWGLAYGAMPIALQIWMVKAAPDIQEGGMALFVANFQISIALGSFLGGQVVDSYGLLNAMNFGGGIAILSLAILWIFGRAVRS